jgi:hypothetical protein
MNYETTQDLNVQAINNINAPSLATSAVLVSLSRSVPDLVKNDPEAAKALAKLKNADSDSVGAKKKLIASKAHDNLQELSRAIYRYHVDNTLPWGNLGARLLPHAKSIDYQVQMDEFLKQFQMLKEDFLDESLFPSVYELERRIGVRLEYDPIADPNDFRVQVGNQAAEAMKEQFSGVLKNRVEAAYADVFKRLREPLENMSAKLNYVDEKDKTKFRDTLVGNVNKFVELMRSCNITSDPTMTRITNDLRDALDGVTPEMLRNSPAQRAETKAKVDRIISTIPEPSLDF